MVAAVVVAFFLFLSSTPRTFSAHLHPRVSPASDFSHGAEGGERAEKTCTEGGEGGERRRIKRPAAATMMAIERVFFLAFLSLEEAFPYGELCPRSALAREARLEEEARDAEKKRANDALKEDKSGRRVVREEGAEEGRKRKRTRHSPSPHSPFCSSTFSFASKRAEQKVRVLRSLFPALEAQETRLRTVGRLEAVESPWRGGEWKEQSFCSTTPPTAAAAAGFLKVDPRPPLLVAAARSLALLRL